MKCPYCKEDVTLMHKASREIAKENPDTRVYAVCIQCAQPLVRMVWGFRRPTEAEMVEIASIPKRRDNLSTVWSNRSKHVPEKQVEAYWKEIANAFMTAANPPPPGALHTMQMVYVLGARTAKDAIKDIVTADLPDEDTHAALMALEERIEALVHDTVVEPANTFFSGLNKEKEPKA